MHVSFSRTPTILHRLRHTQLPKRLTLITACYYQRVSQSHTFVHKTAVCEQANATPLVYQLCFMTLADRRIRIRPPLFRNNLA